MLVLAYQLARLKAEVPQVRSFAVRPAHHPPLLLVAASKDTMPENGTVDFLAKGEEVPEARVVLTRQFPHMLPNVHHNLDELLPMDVPPVDHTGIQHGAIRHVPVKPPRPVLVIRCEFLHGCLAVRIPEGCLKLETGIQILIRSRIFTRCDRYVVRPKDCIVRPGGQDH